MSEHFNNDAYFLHLKQKEILEQNQNINLNGEMQAQKINEDFNFKLGENNQEENSSIGNNYLEKTLDFIAKQNMLNMNIKPNIPKR